MGVLKSRLEVEALGPAGSYRARAPVAIHDVGGRPMGALSIVSAPYVSRAVAALRKAEPVALDERLDVLAAAAEAFRTATIGGLSVSDYHLVVSRVAGLPLSVVRASTEHIAGYAAAAYRHALYARPDGAVTTRQDPRTRSGAGIWARRGAVFGVHAAGNHPGVHTVWLEAIALGYRVAVRPSRKEPFTPQRLVSALRSAGLGADQLVLLPTDHGAADEMLRMCDLSVVYGGDDVVRKYADRPSVLTQGPGRSKVLLTADTDWREQVELIADSVSGGGGTACTNATAVFVEGDPAPVAAALAERLSNLPSLPPEDEYATLPVQPLTSARKLEEQLLRLAAGTTPLLGGDGIVHDLGDGSAVLRPAVHLLDSAADRRARAEFGFPCVWVAPWSREEGLEPLRDTLVLTALTGDEELVGRLLAEPTIRNLYAGPCPTHWTGPGVPHDGYLASFLMEAKGFIRP